MNLFSVLTRLMLGVTALVSVGLRDVTNVALILTNDIAFDSQSSTPVSLSLGSGAVVTPTMAPFTNSGASGNRFTACLPTPQSYSSGAILWSYSVECAQKTTAQLVQLGRTRFLKTQGSGSQVIQRNMTLSGSHGERGGSGSISFNDGEYLCAVSASGSAAQSAGNCVLKANWSEMYYPY